MGRKLVRHFFKTEKVAGIFKPAVFAARIGGARVARAIELVSNLYKFDRAWRREHGAPAPASSLHTRTHARNEPGVTVTQTVTRNGYE